MIKKKRERKLKSTCDQLKISSTPTINLTTWRHPVFNTLQTKGISIKMVQNFAQLAALHRKCSTIKRILIFELGVRDMLGSVRFWVLHRSGCWAGLFAWATLEAQFGRKESGACLNSCPNRFQMCTHQSHCQSLSQLFHGPERIVVMIL